VVAAAGPGSNIALAMVAALAFHALGGAMSVRPGLFEVVTLLNTAVSINVLLAVFNMIPVPPLDGGNVLLGVLPPGPTRIVEQLRPYGFLILYALMLTGMLNTMLGPIVGYLRYVLGI
jgi:Zn-dependent protease